MASVIEATGLTARYDESTVLFGVDLCVEAGTIVALLGSNGAGKTTTFRALTGAIATTGTVRIAGDSIRKRSPVSCARLGIAHVPEGRGTLGSFTVWENLKLGAYVKRDAQAIRRAYERVVEYFPILGRRRDQLAATLSGGEQQMLAIGRALMAEPTVMLLDEPSLGLAPLIVRDIFTLLETINRRDGTTIVIAEQNASMALGLASHAYVLETGRIALAGPASELYRDDAVRRAYLGA